MTSRTVHLGFEVGSAADVEIPIRHMAVTGQTQESGKTTALTALIARATLPAIAFLTKRGEGEMAGRKILPFFQERADWQFVQSILESTMKERMKFERAWIVRACQGAKTLADVQRNIVRLEGAARNALSKDVYMLLGEYLERVVPMIARLPKAGWSDLSDTPRLAVMDLIAYPEELQMLVISSTLEQIHKHETGVITIIPEAWKFIPQGRNTPVKIVAEKLAREGAALRNYLWIDSQDMAAVDKMMLRACAVWLIGVQREANEIKRALSNMPAGLKKPKAEQVATLQLGQFYACFGKSILKTYVQPAWLDETAGKRIAAGRLDVHDAQPLPPLDAMRRELNRYEEEHGCLPPHTTTPKQPAQAGTGRVESPAGSAASVALPISSQTFAEEEELPINPQTLEALKLAIKDGAKDTALQLLESISGNHSSGTAANLPAVERSGAANSPARSEGYCGEECSAPSETRLVQLVLAQVRRDPLLVRLSQEQPVIEVRINRATVSMDDSSINGKIALLIHAKYFDQPRPFVEVRKELIRRGMTVKTPDVAISKSLAKFVDMGFFWRNEANGFELAPGAASRVVAA